MQVIRAEQRQRGSSPSGLWRHAEVRLKAGMLPALMPRRGGLCTVPATLA